jgi:hypothetical protein
MKRVIKQDGGLILIDYQVPLPRNVWGISARAIEYFAGGSHYRSFREYITNHGLEDIIKNQGLREKDRTSLMNGLLIATKVGIG